MNGTGIFRAVGLRRKPHAEWPTKTHAGVLGGGWLDLAFDATTGAIKKKGPVSSKKVGGKKVKKVAPKKKAIGTGAKGKK